MTTHTLTGSSKIFSQSSFTTLVLIETYSSAIKLSNPTYNPQLLLLHALQHISYCIHPLQAPWGDLSLFSMKGTLLSTDLWHSARSFTSQVTTTNTLTNFSVLTNRSKPESTRPFSWLWQDQVRKAGTIPSSFT